MPFILWKHVMVDQKIGLQSTNMDKNWQKMDISQKSIL